MNDCPLFADGVAGVEGVVDVLCARETEASRQDASMAMIRRFMFFFISNKEWMV